ncbi:hypothetical protein CDD81_258 [Ophiocordyceps australis]|uniref:Xaa-Pro aminopeptidase n=1 Tax=Ophiocordyceps australis TaxID=1399860 RepID=A0A2C5Y9M0_9HYPO|nr:hypothetical protein CDD81_258 [Ophiocordyceps australis]
MQAYEAILKGKYPAKAHAKRVVDLLRSTNGVLYLHGAASKLQEDNDSPQHFRQATFFASCLPMTQRRNFYYLTGCNLADCHFAYDIKSCRSTLFIPPIDPAQVIWCGLPLSADDALLKYDVDEVKYTTDVNPTLTRLATQSAPSTIYALANQVPDNVTFLEFATKDFSALRPAIEGARVVKDDYEVAMMHKANDISSQAHKAVVEAARKAANERELEAVFLQRCIANGAKEMAYPPILASGTAAATLHYVDNDKPLQGKLNLLIDAGAEWDNYAADITRTLPLSGKFTPESRQIYDIVLTMQQESLQLVKAGALWDAIHLHAHRVAIRGLVALGILRGSQEEILNARTSVAFFPHGLGHFLGLDTHDVGGNPDSKDNDALYRYLRLRGKLPAGSVVTVEPGIYFCEFIINPYLQDPAHSKFIDSSILQKYWTVGGVRIEDNILVTQDGYQNLTSAVKDPEKVEALVTA